MIPVKLPKGICGIDLPPVSPDASTIYATFTRTLSDGTTRTLSTGDNRTIYDALSGLRPQMIRKKLPPSIISVEI